jgi:hypothetical protein
LVAQAGVIFDASLAFEFHAFAGPELKEGIADVSGKTQNP